MDISPRSGSKRASEPVDDWLRTEGYFRKNAPHDATCLFRAVSEQIYLTQYYHLKVREQCVEFMRKNEKLFEENVKISFDNYLDQLSCVTEWGGNMEIQAMAQLYKRDFVIFNSTKLERYMATDNGFKKSIYLCQLGPKVYESVFKREIISTAAFCQSIMYQTLYKDVFNMSTIDNVVQTMLHDRTVSMRHDKFFLRSNLDQRDQLATDLLTKLDPESSPLYPKTERAPFPYRVAKALDPNIYRNIDFDIWHELRKEVRCTGWTRWNDSELQIGAKCLVQLEQETTEPNNNNTDTTKLQTPDANGNPQEKPNAKKVPALLIGHIQEMSKDEGPVVVFIEELGEKKTVPFNALKPLLATRKPHLPLGVISPRKHLNPHDHSPKYRNKWSQSTRKPKDTINTNNNNNNNNLDSINNNDIPDRAKKCLNEWEDSYQNPTVILKPFTSVENYHINNNFMNSSINTIEARPVSIVLDNPQPLMTAVNDPRMEKEEINNPKPSASPTNNNNNLMMNNNNLNQVDAYEKSQGHGHVHEQIQSQGQLNEMNNPSPVMIQPPPPHQEQSFYPQSMTPIYAPSASVMCVSSEGMYPVQYYHQGEVSGPPAPPIQDRSFRPINISAAVSTDVTGADLPYSDPVTLRFFYNLGIESFRCGHMWPPGSITYGGSYVPQVNAVPIVTPVAPVAPVADAAQSGLTPRRDDEVPGRVGYQGKRRNDGNERNSGSGRNSGMSSDSRGSYRGNYRKEGNFQGNGGNGDSFEYRKNKSYGGEDKDGRDIRDQRDQRKNANRFNNSHRKINNDNRGRNFERNTSFQQDYHKVRDSSHCQGQGQGQGQGQAYGFKGDNHLFRRVQNEQQHQINPQGIHSNQQFQGNYQQPVYNEVYYPSDNQGYYPSSGNFYPVPFMPPSQESGEASGPNGTWSVCAGVENFQPPMSPMYPQYVYPPPGIYPGVNAGGGEGNWYPVGGPQGFVPYQVPVTQPPPNMVRPPTSS